MYFVERFPQCWKWIFEPDMKLCKNPQILFWIIEPILRKCLTTAACSCVKWTAYNRMFASLQVNLEFQSHTFSEEMLSPNTRFIHGFRRHHREQNVFYKHLQKPRYSNVIQPTSDHYFFLLCLIERAHVCHITVCSRGSCTIIGVWTNKNLVGDWRLIFFGDWIFKDFVFFTP